MQAADQALSHPQALTNAHNTSDVALQSHVEVSNSGGKMNATL